MRATAADVTGPRVDNVTLRTVDAGDPELAAARAVADVAFTAGGTESGSQGTAERDMHLAGLAPDMVAHLRDRAAPWA
ncbi:MAG: hypothetical protein ACREOD_10000 [Candidatus Dormibacteria bacterium]